MIEALLSAARVDELRLNVMTTKASRASKVRVLHLGGSGPMYGAEHWILALLSHLPPSIESVIGCIQDTPDGPPALCTAAARRGFGAVVFDAPGRINFSAIEQIRRFLCANAIDVLHTHGYKADLVGLLARRGTRCKTLATPHGWSTEAGCKLALYEALDRVAFRLFDAVAPLSPELHLDIAGRVGLGRKVHYISNGVDFSEIDTVSASEELQAQRAAGTRLIGYVGQLIPRKNVSTLIRAFARLECRATELLVIGDGPQRRELEALSRDLHVEDRIRFCGFRDDRIALMKCLDLLVLPSKLEGIPRCVMEAMGAGVAVLGSDIAGCRELIVDGVTGRLFQSADERRLARLLDMLLADESARQSLAEAGRRFVRREHSADLMASRYAALYADLAARGSTTPALREMAVRG